MIKIIKSEEPQGWKEYLQTPGALYQRNKDLVESLIKEQGYICAYCMRRIPCRDRLYEKDGQNYALTQEDSRVEHVKSRKAHPDLQLNYDNMVLCCPGHIGADEHCDRLKGERDLSFSPTDTMIINSLSYKNDGTIISSVSEYDKELNDVLNLNTPLLKANRKEAWEEAKKQIIAQNKGRNWNKALVQGFIEKYSTKHTKEGEDRYIPYCGIIIYFLQKKLRLIL